MMKSGLIGFIDRQLNSTQHSPLTTSTFSSQLQSNYLNSSPTQYQTYESKRNTQSNQNIQKMNQDVIIDYESDCKLISQNTKSISRQYPTYKHLCKPNRFNIFTSIFTLTVFQFTRNHHSTRPKTSDRILHRIILRKQCHNPRPSIKPIHIPTRIKTNSQSITSIPNHIYRFFSNSIERIFTSFFRS